MPTDQTLVVFGHDHDVELCDVCDGKPGVYVRRYSRGDDPLECFVTYRHKAAPNSERVRAGIAICDSVVVDHHLLTSAPHVRPASTRLVRLAFPSGAFGNVEVQIPARYLEKKRDGGSFFMRASGTSLPWIVVVGQTAPSTCEGQAAKSATVASDGIVACEDKTTLWIMSSIAAADEVAQCVSTRRHGAAKAGCGLGV